MIFKFLLIGSLAGFTNGFFSSGGGMFLVPFFIKFTDIKDKQAFATSVSIILPLSITSASIYIYKNGFDFYNALPFLIGGLLGGIISGFVFKKIPTIWLKKSLAILIIYAGVRSLLW